jgi:hypothetical protein
VSVRGIGWPQQETLDQNNRFKLDEGKLRKGKEDEKEMVTFQKEEERGRRVAVKWLA